VNGAKGARATVRTSCLCPRPLFAPQRLFGDGLCGDGLFVEIHAPRHPSCIPPGCEKIPSIIRHRKRPDGVTLTSLRYGVLKLLAGRAQARQFVLALAFIDAIPLLGGELAFAVGTGNAGMIVLMHHIVGGQRSFACEALPKRALL